MRVVSFEGEQSPLTDVSTTSEILPRKSQCERKTQPKQSGPARTMALCL